MKGKTAIGLGIFIVALVAVSVVSTYAARTPVSSRTGTSGHPWWTEGLTEQQITEIKDQMWNLRQQAAEEGWTDEQLMLAMHNLLAQYGIDASGPNFVDANGDGICDSLGRGQMGHHMHQYVNCTFCPGR